LAGSSVTSPKVSPTSSEEWTSKRVVLGEQISRCFGEKSIISGRGLANVMDAWLGAERDFGKSNKGFMFVSREGTSEFHVRFYGKSHHGLSPHWNIEEYVGRDLKTNIKFYVDWTL